MASAAAARRTRAVESFGSAADCVGTITPDISLFAITRGQFSMLDIAKVLVKHVGPCEVSVWTWAIAAYELECFEAFMADGEIKAGRLIIDFAAQRRNQALIQQWRSIYGVPSVRVCKNHAKILTVETADYRLLVRGSMNLNFNPRFEQFDITGGGADFDLVRRLELELPVLEADCGNLEADNATKLGNAFERQELEMFAGTKVWAK